MLACINVWQYIIISICSRAFFSWKNKILFWSVPCGQTETATREVSNQTQIHSLLKPSGDLIWKPHWRSSRLEKTNQTAASTTAFPLPEDCRWAPIDIAQTVQRQDRKCVPFTDSQQDVSADPDSGRPDQLWGPGGSSGWVQVGHSVQHRLDHKRSHGGLQAARAGLLHACHHCK